MTAERVRRNPRDRASMRRAAPRAQPQETASVRDLADGTPLVAVLIEGGTGALTQTDAGALAFGRKLAGLQGHGLLAISLSPDLPAGLGAAGVDRVAVAPATPDAVARGLAGAWDAFDLVHAVAFDGTAGAEVLRRCAALTGRALRANVAALDAEGCLCLEDAGRRERRRDAAPLLIALPDRNRPDPGDPEPGAACAVDLPAVPADPDAPVERGLERASPDALPLTEADLVLSAGAGVTDWDLFHRLAHALDAAIGGSRVVCDAGHLARDRQVGISGTVVSPRCYVALGISGAGQHLQGIEASRQVVAVNSDPHAPIIGRADLAIVAESGALMQALLTRLEPPA